MGTLIWRGYTGLVAAPKSGGVVLAERVNVYQTFVGSYADCVTYAFSHYRGVTGTIGGVSHYVDECRVDSDTGGRGTVSVTWVRLDVVPPDEWTIVPFEIEPRLEKNAHFSTLTTEDVKRARMIFKASSAQVESVAQDAVDASTNSALANALIAKWLAGGETFYLAGQKYQWVKYYSSLSGVTTYLGGVRQSPGGPGSDFVPSGLAWLRLADEVVWNNGLYKVTRSWLGAPSGYWDTDLYPSG